MATLVPRMESFQGENPEVIIIADQSGSMQGGRTTTLVAALRILLKSLPVGMKFNICVFGSRQHFLWQKSHTYNEASLDEALRYLGTFNSHMGGTETLSAVQAAINSRDSTKNLSLILATDGDIWQQESLFSYLDEQLAMSKKHIRVFPLGIGGSVSSGLIEGVARAGNGFASSVGEGEKLDTKVIRMLKGAMTPDSGTYTMEVLYHEEHDEVEYDVVERVTDSLRIIMLDDSESSEGLGPSAMVVDEEKTPTGTSHAAGIVAPKLLQAPQVVPPLYPLTRTTVYILLSPRASRATPKTVILRNDSPENPFEISIPVEILSEPATKIHSLAAKRAILELEDGRGWLNYAKDRQGALIKDISTAEKYNDLVKAEAVRLGVEYQITGKYTSSVAVESSSLLGEGEKVAERDITIATRFKATEGGMSMTSRHHGICAPRYLPSAAPYNIPPMSPLKSTGVLFGATNRTLQRQEMRELASLNVDVGVSLGRKRSSVGLSRGARAGGAYFCDTRSRPAEEELSKSARVDHDSDEDMGFGLFEKKGSIESASNQVQKLIALQSFAGFWNYEKNLLKICSVTGSSKQPKKADSKVWATIIALEYLNAKLSSEKETWQLVALKAWAWLNAQGFEKDGNDGQKLLQDAKQLIQGA